MFCELFNRILKN